MISSSKGSPVSVHTLRETANALLVVVGGDGSVQSTKNAIPAVSATTSEVLI